MATNALLTDDEVFAATRRCIEAWNTLDLEATLATYSDDVVYRDPGTIGRIEGKADLRRYLAKFFKVWRCSSGCWRTGGSQAPTPRSACGKWTSPGRLVTPGRSPWREWTSSTSGMGSSPGTKRSWTACPSGKLLRDA